MFNRKHEQRSTHTSSWVDPPMPDGADEASAADLSPGPNLSRRRFVSMSAVAASAVVLAIPGLGQAATETRNDAQQRPEAVDESDHGRHGDGNPSDAQRAESSDANTHVEVVTPQEAAAGVE